LSADIIEVSGLCNRFGDFIVHENLDLSVKTGEIIGVVGGSGSGKSVLMRSILALNRPQAGRIQVLGKNALATDLISRQFIESNTGVLFQNAALFSSLTVLENVMVPLREHSTLPEEVMTELALIKIQLAGLAVEAAYKYPSELSGGMRKRAGIARALALDPELLFLDEPTAGLDPIGAAGFDQLILSIQKALGLTVFLITHDLDTLYTICDRVAVIADRKVLVNAPIETVAAFDHPWIQEYFHGPRGRAAQAATEMS
jgi:phospholipid/cholesterol/gamma-HCH transport system ATP-binding protein